jgi:hypothetical protein
MAGAFAPAIFLYGAMMAQMHKASICDEKHTSGPKGPNHLARLIAGDKSPAYPIGCHRASAP